MLKELTETYKELVGIHENGNQNYKQEPGRNEEYNIWNKNIIQEITYSLDEGEDRISELQDKVEKNTQVEHLHENKTQKNMKTA